MTVTDRESDLGVPSDRSGIKAPRDFKRRLVTEMETSLEDLEKLCRDRGVDTMAARRFVRQLTEGLDTRESIALVRRLIEGGAAQGSNGQGPDVDRRQLVSEASLDEMLEGLDARRKKVGQRIEEITKEKAALKVEEKKLNQAAAALRKITGAENREFFCDECNLPFASRQGLSTHKTKTHRKAS